MTFTTSGCVRVTPFRSVVLSNVDGMCSCGATLVPGTASIEWGQLSAEGGLAFRGLKKKSLNSSRGHAVFGDPSAASHFSPCRLHLLPYSRKSALASRAETSSTPSINSGVLSKASIDALLPSELSELAETLKRLTEKPTVPSDSEEFRRLKSLLLRIAKEVPSRRIPDDIAQRALDGGVAAGTFSPKSAIDQDARGGGSGTEAGIAQESDLRNSQRTARQQWNYEKDLEGILSTSTGLNGQSLVPQMVERKQLIEMRTRLNRKLSEANANNRYLKRELYQRDEVLKKNKAEILAITTEIKELAKCAKELLPHAFNVVTRKINGRYIPSHLALQLEALSQTLDAHLEGLEAIRLREIPLLWFGMAEDVKVMGSFDGWSFGEQMSPETTGVMTKFSCVLRLRPGRYEIKFLVDGQWRIAPDWPTVGEGLTQNNLLIVL